MGLQLISPDASETFEVVVRNRNETQTIHQPCDDEGRVYKRPGVTSQRAIKVEVIHDFSILSAIYVH